MSGHTDWNALAARCEAGTADEQDALLTEAAGLLMPTHAPDDASYWAWRRWHDPFHQMLSCKAYESAALMLVPENADSGGERYRLEQWNTNGGVHAAHIRASAWVAGAPRAYAATPALALLAACYRMGPSSMSGDPIPEFPCGHERTNANTEVPAEIADKLDAWLSNLDLELSGVSLNQLESVAIGGAVLTFSDLREVLQWAADQIERGAFKVRE